MKPDIYRINKDYPYDLLLLADETIEAISKYIYNSEVYIACLGERGSNSCILPLTH